MSTKKSKAADIKDDKNVQEAPHKEKMCMLPIKDVKAVCDWLNADDMILPQNQVRRALAILMSAKVCE